MLSCSVVAVSLGYFLLHMQILMSRPLLQELFLEKGEAIWLDQRCAVREFRVDVKLAPPFPRTGLAPDSCRSSPFTLEYLDIFFMTTYPYPSSSSVTLRLDKRSLFCTNTYTWSS